ncbi:hypothetical protein ACSSS7_001000 [Eimeria intestinalis]
MALALLGLHAQERQRTARSDWAPPLLLPSLLSPASHSWRRAHVSHAADEAASPAFFEQIPHVASAFARRAASSKHQKVAASDNKPVRVYRDQYKPLDFVVESVDLIIDLDEENTKVTSNIRLRRRPAAPPEDLLLDGDALQLEKAFLNGSELVSNEVTGYSLTAEGKLRISKDVLPEDDAPFEIQTVVFINPKANLELMGLYLSEDTFVTHCEPAGFRRITYYPDRPDVLARFEVRLEADAERYPVLLSNGNKVDEGPVYGNPSRHYAVFEDPYPKPSYLFAVVAGKLGVLQDSFKTMEGLTTFREELFSAAVGSAAVDRINKMKLMLGHQFKEDAGPLAHPIRPDSYAAVDNLYTLTVYEKGSEVHRMYQTILGVEGFRKGMNLYFERHDGTAVTSEDFRAAMEDANNVDLSQFALWYTQAGTPHVRVEKPIYDPERRVFSITLSQHTPGTPGQPAKQPQVIPMKVGLIGKDSKADLLNPPTKVILLKQESETVDFFDINEDCIPSLFRDFSAPVKLLHERSPEELAFLMAHDTDPVNKWLSAQKLASSIILKRAALLVENELAEFEALPQEFVDALETTLLDKNTDKFVKALTLRLPELNTLEQEMHPADPEALYRARRSVMMELALALKEEMVDLYTHLTVHDVEGFDQKSLGRRRLRNELLMFLSEFRDREAAERAYKHFHEARCMTDKFYSLWSLASMQQPERDQAFATFYQDAKGRRTLTIVLEGSHAQVDYFRG